MCVRLRLPRNPGMPIGLRMALGTDYIDRATTDECRGKPHTGRSRKLGMRSKEALYRASTRGGVAPQSPGAKEGYGKPRICP